MRGYIIGFGFGFSLKLLVAETPKPKALYNAVVSMFFSILLALCIPYIVGLEILGLVISNLEGAISKTDIR